MTEQGFLLKMMADREIGQNKDLPCVITNTVHVNPKTISVSPDEVCFITFVRIFATSDFIFRYSSPGESRTIQKTVPMPFTFESNTITRHVGRIRIAISNTDSYEVSVVTLKFIK